MLSHQRVNCSVSHAFLSWSLGEKKAFPFSLYVNVMLTKSYFKDHSKQRAVWLLKSLPSANNKKKKKQRQPFCIIITAGVLTFKRFPSTSKLYMYINYQVYGLSIYNKTIFTNKYFMLLFLLSHYCSLILIRLMLMTQGKISHVIISHFISHALCSSSLSKQAILLTFLWRLMKQSCQCEKKIDFLSLPTFTFFLKVLFMFFITIAWFALPGKSFQTLAHSTIF